MLTPFLYAVGERRLPSSLCIFAVTGGHERWTTVELPRDILDLVEEQQLRAIAPCIDDYRKRYSDHVPFFGPLVGFRFVRSLDHFEFDVEGHFVRHIQAPFPVGECAVVLK